MEGHPTQEIVVVTHVDVVVSTHSQADVDVDYVLLLERIAASLLGEGASRSLLLRAEQLPVLKCLLTIFVALLS